MIKNSYIFTTLLLNTWQKHLIKHMFAWYNRVVKQMFIGWGFTNGKCFD